MRKLMILALMAILPASLLAQGLKLPALVGDHMVLQRESQVKIWGWADAGDRVQVETGWDGQKYKVKAAADGKWSVLVATGAAGGPHDVKIRADKEIVLKDVLLGEVWICSGQSNMEWPLRRAESARPEAAKAHYPELRLFKVGRRIAAIPREDVAGSWAACTPDVALGFSAVGYFFGRDLHEELGVPVGMINTSWGGTPSEAWTSKEKLREMGGFDKALDMLDAGSEPDLLKAERRRDSITLLKKQMLDFDNAENPGMKGAWMKPGMEEAGWKDLPCPAEWTALEGLGMNEGIVWLRKTIEIPEAWVGKTLSLELGPIDEMDRTWVNGVEVGAMLNIEDWDKARYYSVPATLVKGRELLIAIRVANTVAEGGVFGEEELLKLYPSDGSGADPLMLAGTWKYRVAAEFPPLPQTLNPRTASVLYNGMLAPLTSYGIKGAIWYQGEGNSGRAYQYRTIFPGMITDWRAAWDRGDFPFYFAQIAPFNYGQQLRGAELREAQLMTLDRVPNSGMAVLMDIGDPEDIHPTNKRDVGARLVLWALANDYGRDIVYSGPLYRGIRIEGDAIRVEFRHSGSGLQSIGGAPSHFELAGSDRIYHPAKAVIEGHSVVLRSEAVPQPVAVRYAFGNSDEPNLYNMEGLPASSFCSDDWPRVTQK